VGLLNWGAVVLLSLIASHRDLDLELLERLSVGAQSVGRSVAAIGAAPTGAVVLATCNRFEVYVEVGAGRDADTAVVETTAVIASAAGLPVADVAASLHVLRGRDVPAHLFSVAAGLESMVVGEREISGQVRRSLTAARAGGTTSTGLERLFQTASRASRAIRNAAEIRHKHTERVDHQHTERGERKSKTAAFQDLL